MALLVSLVSTKGDHSRPLHHLAFASLCLPEIPPAMLSLQSTTVDHIATAIFSVRWGRAKELSFDPVSLLVRAMCQWSGESKCWGPIIALLGNLNFLGQMVGRFASGEIDGPFNYVDSPASNSAHLLKCCLSRIPRELISKNQKLSQLIANDFSVNSFAYCLYLTYYHSMGHYDSKACCTNCGKYRIIHGGIHDCEDNYPYRTIGNYCSWCTNCFWSWWSRPSYINTELPSVEFDYTTNTYNIHHYRRG